KVLPAIVSVPVRVAPGLASKVKVARPPPVPLAEVRNQLALAVAVQGPAARTMSESLPPAGASSRVGVASPTSKAPMSTSAPPARGNPAPRWSVVRLYGLWVVSRPASKAGLSAGRAMVGVGPPLLARGPRPKSAVVVVVLTPVGRPLLPVSRLLLP